VLDIWTNMNASESTVTYELIWMSPMSHVFICPILMTPHSYVWHDSFICATCQFMCATYDSFICATCLIDMCDTTHLYVRHASFVCVACSFMCATYDSFICATCLIHMCGMLIHVCDIWLIFMCNTDDASFICVTWLIHMCDMAHSHVRHASFVCATYDSFICALVRHASFICATCLIHMCDMTHSYVLHDFSMCVTSSFICATWHNSNAQHFCLRGNWEKYDPTQSMNALMNSWIEEWMNEAMHEWIHEWTNEWMNQRRINLHIWQWSCLQGKNPWPDTVTQVPRQGHEP